MENTSKAIGLSLPISTKKAVEICSLLRGKTTEESKKILEQVIEKKVAVPFKRFNRDVPHKHGRIAAGRYPKIASQHILRLINVAEANAQNKGLIVPFIIKKLIANKGPKQWHYGRQSRTKMKRTHVEIVLVEGKKKISKKKETKKQEKKTEQKPKIVDNTKKENKK